MVGVYTKIILIKNFCYNEIIRTASLGRYFFLLVMIVENFNLTIRLISFHKNVEYMLFLTSIINLFKLVNIMLLCFKLLKSFNLQRISNILF